MSYDFCPLANVAVFDVLLDCFPHAWRLVLSLVELGSFGRSSMAGLWNVVVSSHKVGPYPLVVRNPNLSLMPKVSVFPLAQSQVHTVHFFVSFVQRFPYGLDFIILG